jgi:DNA-directed RNA polymerase specialized sigma24 family protein
VAALTNAERQRRWRASQLKTNPSTYRADERWRKAEKRPLRKPASKTVAAPNFEFVAAFDHEFPRFANYVKAKLYGRIAKQDGQDLASEVRLRFLEQGGRIRSAKNVKGWMYGVLKSLLADRGREANRQFELVGALRHEIKEEFAEGGFRIVSGPFTDDNRDDEPTESDAPKVELGRRERNERDAETKDRKENPYYRLNDDELEAKENKRYERVLRESPNTDPLSLGSWTIRIGEPRKRLDGAIEPTGIFLNIQDASLRVRRLTPEWRR